MSLERVLATFVEIDQIEQCLACRYLSIKTTPHLTISLSDRNIREPRVFSHPIGHCNLRVFITLGHRRRRLHLFFVAVVVSPSLGWTALVALEDVFCFLSIWTGRSKDPTMTLMVRTLT